MVGACIGTPFQLIKTRMQAAARGASAAGGAAAAAGAAARQPYTGLSNALATIVKNEGAQGGQGLAKAAFACCSAVLARCSLQPRPSSTSHAQHPAPPPLAPPGLFGLYRGAHLNMLKIAVASAVQLAVFDGVKARLQRDEGSWGRRHPTAALFAAAMAAGLAVTAVIMPVG